MTTPTTLFAQILPIFTNQTERVATEALRHILLQSEPARQALQSTLLSAGVATGPLTRFQTEAGGDGGKRVDLVCGDENQVERVLIEAKFWAGLTDNQPNAYLARLPQTGPAALLFIAPAERMETLWPELCGRAQQAYQTTGIVETGDFRSAAIDGSARKMMMTSWRALLEQMEARASAAGDAAAMADIRQLRGLTELMDADAFLPLHSDELGQEFPRRMLNMVRLVDDATQRTIANPWADAGGLRVTPQWYGYGRYFRLDGAVVWFGINFQYWAGSGQTPLWLQHQPDNVWYPVILPTGVEYAAVLDSVVAQLDIIGQHINPERNKQ